MVVLSGNSQGRFPGYGFGAIKEKETYCYYPLLQVNNMSVGFESETFPTISDIGHCRVPPESNWRTR